MYDIVLVIHLGSMLWNVALVIGSDTAGLLWVLGITPTVKRRWLERAHRLIYVGLAFSIVSGAYLFSTVSAYLLTVPAFYVKVGFVAALLINAFFIGKHIKLAAETRFADTTRGERIKLFLSAAVSVVGWVGVLVAATQLGL